MRRIALTGRLRFSEHRAVDLIRAAGTGAVITMLSTPPEQRDPSLAQDLYEAVLRQILTDAPERAGNALKATVVACRAASPQLDMLSSAERHLLDDWLDRAIAVL